ncbi:MAG: type VI secretion system baseplate subunit TssF [Proteobacteria bacterium]|nr:type VI secretion system baseplate subunit TssF [Pseudomonadota bacterium]
MDRQFLDLYNRELAVLLEQAGDFAEEYPGIAERLGGLVAERMDPMVGALLEGTAFLAARVQLKLKQEFPEFTSNLLDQLVPNYLAPTPSVMMVKIHPPFADSALFDGKRIRRDGYFDATYRERERSVACRYRLCSEIVLWPLDILAAEYFSNAGPMQAAGLSVGHNVLSGLRLSLTARSAERLEDEISPTESRTKPECWLSNCRIKELPIHFVGSESDSVALYEQMIADLAGVYFRYLDDFGDPVIIPLPAGCVEQIGFDEQDSLFPRDTRVFRGSELLREYFVFPRKFLGIKLTKLDTIMPKLRCKNAEIIFAFDDMNPRLAAAVQPAFFSLYSAPAINLFEKTADRIFLKSRFHEHHVVPDRSHHLNFEAHRILDVYAHYPGEKDKVPVAPLYAVKVDDGSANKVFYTMRRLPRRRTVEEKAYGKTSDYVGTDVFISFVDLSENAAERAPAELSIRTLCSNRHLTEHLPVGQGGADLQMLDDTSLKVTCVAGPTLPREPVASQLHSRNESTQGAAISWRLINMLTLNYLGTTARAAGNQAEALREMLSMFADASDSVIERKIRAVRRVDSKPVVRRVRERTGTGTARGQEIKVTLDEKGFEGSGAFLLGAVLERFFADYSGFNHFTQTVVVSNERGEIMRWPTRMGTRRSQ